MTACNPKPSKDKDGAEEEPYINGGNSDQPIMDGWTFEMAAEYYLREELGYEYSRVIRNEDNWRSPQALATLTWGHVQVKLPVQQEDVMPRFGVTYRQPETGGTITFNGPPSSLPTIYGDTLQAVGEATFHLEDPMYDYQSETNTAYIQSRGQGLYTLFLMEGKRNPDTNEWQDDCNPSWFPVIISVYPGGDSLTISRGLDGLETFIPVE